MASDLKIEIFAYDIFSNMFMTLGEIRPSIFQIYGDECLKINSYVEVCDRMFYEAVLSRFIFFKTIYLKHLTTKRIKSLKSLSDCYDYAIKICDRNDLFGHLTVFDQMFATLAFIITLCLRIYYDNTCAIDVLNYGHLFWAMYFDKLTEKFYKEGGWNELKRVANSYFEFTSFIDLLEDSEDDLNAMKETFDNYHHFKRSIPFYKYKHVSKQWSKFRIKSFESYIIVPLSYQYSVDAHEADLLLEDLKRLCDPHSENCIGSFEKCMTFDSFEEIKANGNDSLAIAHFVPEQKARIKAVYCEELSSNSTGFENLSQSECSFSNLKVVPLNRVGNNINLKSHEITVIEKDLRKANSESFAAHSRNNHIPNTVKTINRQFGTDIGNMPEIINLHSDHSSENISLTIKNEVFPTKNFSSKSIERQNDIASETVPSGTSENDPPKNVLPLICFSPVNEFASIADERMGISKDIDDIDSTSKTSSVDQMAVGEKSENTLPKHVPSPKCLKPVNKCANISYEKTKTPKDTDDLRCQNDDFGISDLQRLILVLGDRQGIEYVRSTLHNSKGIHENLQENLRKRKKRRKKKNKASEI